MAICLKAKRFTCEGDAARHIAEVRGWIDFATCPRCVSDRTCWFFDIDQGSWLMCNGCRRRTSLRWRSAMERSRLPLTTWLSAVRVFAIANDEVSPSVLARELELGSYHSAISLHARIRAALDVAASEGCDEDEEAPYPDDQANGKSLIVRLIAHELSTIRQGHRTWDGQHPLLQGFPRKRKQHRSRRPHADDDDNESDDDAGLRTERVSLRQGAEELGISVATALALARLDQTRRLFEDYGDATWFAPGSLERLAIFRRERFIDRAMAPRRVRVVSRPLPRALWVELKDLAPELAADQGRRKSLYAYLFALQARLAAHYAQHPEHREKRTSRHGLQMAMVETTDLSEERCYRYAGALTRVMHDRAFDGSRESFDGVLHMMGGLDRAARGKKRFASVPGKSPRPRRGRSIRGRRAALPKNKTPPPPAALENFGDPR